jgi:peptidoglycan/LPS O-acetylase OafA/YrhL
MTNSRLVIAAILALLASVVILQNTGTVETRFRLLTTLLIGFAPGVLVTMIYGKQRKGNPRKSSS